VAKVSFEEKGTRSQVQSSKTYVNLRTDIRCEREFLAGRHIYTFCMTLPPDCPSTCKEMYGEVSYNNSIGYRTFCSIAPWIQKTVNRGADL